MRIAKIKIPIEKTRLKKLKEIDLSKKALGSVVALVGKNGAGKTRVLDFVEGYVNTLDAEHFFEDYIEYLPISISKQSVDLIRRGKASLIQYKNSSGAIQEQHKNTIDQIYKSISGKIKLLSKAYIKVVDNDELQKIKESFNNNLTFEAILKNNHFDNLNDQNFLNQAQAQPQLMQNLVLNEFSSFNNNSTIDYLKKLSIDIVSEEFGLYIKNRTNPGIIIDEIKKNKSFQLFVKFQEYVKQFLGKDFDYKQITQGNTVDSILHFNNEPFNLELFSPGQKTLFAYAILFFYLDTNSKTNIKDSIIIIDEPEKHLHPEAQIKLIDALKSIVKEKGQLWIATHSIHILSHLEYDEILMVKDDEIILPSRTTPGKSFNDLMGLENHILELSEFINSISDWAYGNFMCQCFKEPDVILGNDANDPQFKLFKEFILDKSNVKLLDFGAGKGRIGVTLKSDDEINKKIEYTAFEPDNENLEFLRAIPGTKNVYQNKDGIPNDSFDCVILCNVLHEIRPQEWIETLNSIKRVLTQGGFLLIIEDKFLPKGEEANEFGYLILGIEETKKLLKSTDAIELKLNEKELSDRILFTAFRKEQINPDEKSVMIALELLNKNSYKRLKDLRKIKNRESDLSIGRKYANETQLYINSTLAIEAFISKK